ncbi:translation initiation factor Sui1 [Mangrovimicrobium sediminis]|uniref:Translation initiation factor Sui1 n=1 Tax=Mangrovimicrobium sediminis TaxID=2562682 RepID=A0A4Z0M5C9_9GAMM|nr:translation initiation factor Sui1 [Haliea sp. SAOS-164]TGD74903.1 translation initiation factor Sui1 [Haliea sp. SAOS-164]
MSRQRKSPGNLVYSSDQGRLCPGCGAPVADCRCREQRAAAPAGDGIVRLHRETKGRGGKAVTLVRGLPLGETELKALAKTLKRKCGVGGAVKDGCIEIQGEQRELIKAELEKIGYTVKLAGG